MATVTGKRREFQPIFKLFTTEQLRALMPYYSEAYIKDLQSRPLHRIPMKFQLIAARATGMARENLFRLSDGGA